MALISFVSQEAPSYQFYCNIRHTKTIGLIIGTLDILFTVFQWIFTISYCSQYQLLFSIVLISVIFNLLIVLKIFLLIGLANHSKSLQAESKPNIPNQIQINQMTEELCRFQEIEKSQEKEIQNLKDLLISVESQNIINSVNTYLETCAVSPMRVPPLDNNPLSKQKVLSQKNFLDKSESDLSCNSSSEESAGSEDEASQFIWFDQSNGINGK